MFSPSSFTASTPDDTADCACSTTPVATRFTRSSADFERLVDRFVVEPFADDLREDDRFMAERLVVDDRVDDRLAPRFAAAPREADFVAPRVRAAAFRAPPFRAPFFAAPERALPRFADERFAPRRAPPRRAELPPALRLLPPLFFIAIAASPLPVCGLSVLRDIVDPSASFGRIVAPRAATRRIGARCMSHARRVAARACVSRRARRDVHDPRAPRDATALARRHEDGAAGRARPAPSRCRRRTHGQDGLRENGLPKTAWSASFGCSERITTSSRSPTQRTREKSR
jgi:hypothetical protein